MKAELNSLLSYEYVLTNKLVTSLNIRESVLLLFNVRIKKRNRITHNCYWPMAYLNLDLLSYQMKSAEIQIDGQSNKIYTDNDLKGN